MSASVSEVVVQTQPDVEALVQAAVSVLTNDMQIATHDQSQGTHDGETGTVQLLMDTCNSNNIQERLYMCTDCNLAFYGEQGEQEWQWHLKQHKPFKCDLCTEAYEDKESLKTHVRTHSISMPYICDKCGSAYSLKNNLIQHMKTHEDKLFQCGECQVVFKSQANLEKHLKLHTGGTISVFQCETCNKTFSQQKNLVQHMKIHQGSSGKQYKCPECPAAYSYKCHLTRHLIIHTGEKPYKCKFCGKAFNRNAHLIRHRKMHSGGEKEWKCQTCSFAFWEKGDLMRHMKSHEGNRPLKCDYCDQTFVWKRYLYKHLNNHHKSDDKHFCKTCLLCVPSEEELIEHEATAHTNRKPLTHTCHVCKQEFHFKYKLDEHMYEHTGEKAHACQKCPQRFISRRELDRHMMEHLQEVSFRCNTCEKTFSSVNDLQSHVKLHTGNAKFPCMLCNSSFRWRSQLASHMIIHSNDHDFKCGFCTKKFKRKRDLTRHVKIYHDTKPPYNCTECNIDFHSPFNLMQHKTDTHWKDNEIGKRFSCNHCTGVFGIHSDLQKHLSKVHPPRPNVCLICNKKFTLMKFLEKHFELKHEGVDMEIGENFEIRPAETPTGAHIEMDAVINEQETDNVVNTENNGNNMENIDSQEMDEHDENNEFEGMEGDVEGENGMIVMEQIGTQLDEGALSSENVVVAMNELNTVNAPISEAITLAQFSQQASGEDIIPVFLQENYNKPSQPASVPHVVLQNTSAESSQQSGTTVTSSYENSMPQAVQPHVITTIQQPQVVKIRQDGEVVKIRPDGSSVVIRKATNQVKIPTIKRSEIQGSRIIVQQGSNNKAIKIVSLSPQQVTGNQARNTGGSVRTVAPVPVVTMEQGQGDVQYIASSLEQMPSQNNS